MLKNLIQIETETGIKEFELFNGDITDLPFRVDLIAISAFKNDYKPVPRSIIGQFKNQGIDIELLSENPMVDLKGKLGIWVSRKLTNRNFNHIVCVEITGANFTFDDAIKNLFNAIRIIENNGNANDSIAIPILGAGIQKISSKIIIPSLIRHSLEFLKQSKYLNKVIFTVFTHNQADEFSETMDEVLGRHKIDTPNSSIAIILKTEIIKTLDLLLIDNGQKDVLINLKKIVNTDFKTFEFGAISRKAVEFIIQEIHPGSLKQTDLSRKIESLKERDIAFWLISYMHVIRVFGNEALHGLSNTLRKPQSLTDKDLEIVLHCMLRILDFYLAYK